MSLSSSNRNKTYNKEHVSSRIILINTVFFYLAMTMVSILTLTSSDIH